MNIAEKKFTEKINTLKIGNTKEEGGTRDYSLSVGGEITMPFYPGAADSKVLIAFEISYKEPESWPPLLAEKWSGVWDDPVKWCNKCIKEHNASLICISLAEAKNDYPGKNLNKIAQIVIDTIQEIKTPFIVKGTGLTAIDNEVIPRISEALSGEKLLIGPVISENYREITACAIEHGHALIAESPIDINIAKQLNIMLADAGLSKDSIVIDPTTGGLGYGIEYTYSIMERARLAALSGDKSLAYPFINFVGQEAWRAKESSESGWLWEAVTALTLIQAGSGLTVIRDPQTSLAIASMIENI